MRIAVPFERETENIFQHFGKSQYFKFYDTENEDVTDCEVVEASGSGHDAIAAFLDEMKVDVVVCGNIGSGAQFALADRGILVFAGAEGDADAAVAEFLRGDMEGADGEMDAQCCGGGGCGGCGGEESEAGCGGCGGGCGGRRIMLEGPNAGKTCKVHYRGTFNDGTQFDSSYDRGEPLEFVCGAGMMIKGFDAAVVNMEVGQVIDIHLMPEEAYGPSDPNAIFTIETAQLPGSEDLEVGQKVYLANTYGQPFPVIVAAKAGTTITFDANHEMAGKELNFRIELVEVQQEFV